MTTDELATSAPASRRDVLKATGAAAVGLASFIAAANVIGDSPAGAAVSDRIIHIPTTIDMTIDGVSLGNVRSIGPTVRSVVVSAIVDSTGARHFTRQDSNAVALSLSRVYDGSPKLQTWYDGGPPALGSTMPTAIRRDVVLTLRGRNRSNIASLTLHNAWPSEYHPPSWSVPSTTAFHATESVVLVAESMQYQ